MSRSTKVAVLGFDGLHKVVESLGYQHSRGVYAKAVEIDGRERIVISESRSGPWRINKPLVLLDRPPTTDRYTVEETEAIREQMKNANEKMRQVGLERGWSLNPRIAAVRRGNNQ